MTYPSGRRGGEPAQRRFSGFLGNLVRDKRGNTLAMMAAFAIPLAALAGSAVDMSRLYLVKTRLQQACDAGVLAGRKVMTVTTGTTLDDPAKVNTVGTPAASAAAAFFENNFPTGWMSTTGRSFNAVRTSDGQVDGTATVTTPMAIMGMFGFDDTTQTVKCTARLDIGDSDIMFVLDTTGSMACKTGEGCSSTATWARTDVAGTTGYYRIEETGGNGSKISQLRAAVKLFRETLEKNKPAAAHIRYGFVPYSTTVNVGAVIRAKDPSYLVDSWTYASRTLSSASSTTLPTSSNSSNYDAASYSSSPGQYYNGDVLYTTTNSAPAATTVTLTSPNNNKAGCLAKETRKVGTVNYANGTWPTSGTVKRVFPVWSSSTCKTYEWTVKPLWSHTNVTYNTATFKTGASVPDPTKLTGATTKWQGCIEERDTTAGATSYSSASLPADLNPDTVPSSNATRWRPMWPEVIYYRNGTSDGTYAGAVHKNNTNAGSSDAASSAAGSYTALMPNYASGDSLGSSAYYGCNALARTLKEYTTTADIKDFEDYLDGTSAASGVKGNFRAMGRTYHDVGMIWGLRLISPTGLWASTTTAWPGNNPPQRYIVFMTDGLLNTTNNDYAMWGIEKLNKRVTNSSTASPSSYHAQRFQAVCTAAKDKNITIFVVAFDTDGIPDDLKSCATEGFAYEADPSDPDSLKTAFSSIALQIARLRLSK